MRARKFILSIFKEFLDMDIFVVLDTFKNMFTAKFCNFILNTLFLEIAAR